MIKYQGTRGKRKLIGFVLEKRNIERLKQGDPILVDLALFDIDAELLIEFSDDIEATVRKMAPAIGPGTLVSDTRNPKRHGSA